MEPHSVILRAPPLRADVYHLRRAIDGLGYTRHPPFDGADWTRPDVAWGSVRVPLAQEDMSSIEETVARTVLDPMTHAGHVLWSHLKGPQFEVTQERGAWVVTLSNPKSNAEWLADAGLPNSAATWSGMEAADRRVRVVLRALADVAHAREAIDGVSPLVATVEHQADWFEAAEHIARNAAEHWLSPLAPTGRALLPHMRAPYYAVEFCPADHPDYGALRDVCFVTLTALTGDAEWAAEEGPREARAQFLRGLRGRR
jgi:hypothetical protein